MATKKDAEDMRVILIVIGIILLLPFFIFSALFYQILKNKYLLDNSAQRVIDIKRLTNPLVAAAFTTVIFVWGTYLLFGGGLEKNSLLKLSLGSITGTVGILIAYFASKHFAVLYLGFVCDKSRDSCIFPYDMQSYGIADYLSFKWVHDFCGLDSIKLSEIKKISRARGTQLYLHGEFGSRGIIFSNKQKRDEAIALVQSSIGKSANLMFETEKY
jgi:hypothetical protein